MSSTSSTSRLAHVQPQFLCEHQFAGFHAGAIAGDADEIQAQRQDKAPDQVRQEHDRAVEQRHDNQFAPSEVAFDLAGQSRDAPGDLSIGDENAPDLPPPARRNGRLPAGTWRKGRHCSVIGRANNIRVGPVLGGRRELVHATPMSPALFAPAILDFELRAARPL